MSEWDIDDWDIDEKTFRRIIREEARVVLADGAEIERLSVEVKRLQAALREAHDQYEQGYAYRAQRIIRAVLSGKGET